MWDEGSELGVVGKGLNWDLIQAPCPQGGSMDSLSPSKWKLLWKEGKFPGAAEVLPVFGGEEGSSVHIRVSGKNSLSWKIPDLHFPCPFPGESQHWEKLLIWENSGFRFSLSIPWRINWEKTIILENSWFHFFLLIPWGINHENSSSWKISGLAFSRLPWPFPGESTSS